VVKGRFLLLSRKTAGQKKRERAEKKELTGRNRFAIVPILLQGGAGKKQLGL
jgi:hypothetical protein